MSRYAFGTETAQFHVCARCGVVPVVTSRIDGRVYAVVSVNAFENVDATLLRRAPISFDAEEKIALARRKRTGSPTSPSSDGRAPARAARRL